MLTSIFEDEVTCKRCLKELKMKTKKFIETHLDKIFLKRFLYVDPGPDDDGFFAVGDAKELKEASKFWGVSEKLLRAIDEAIKFGLEEVIDELRKDLVDIWKRLDKIERTEDGPPSKEDN